MIESEQISNYNNKNLSNIQNNQSNNLFLSTLNEACEVSKKKIYDSLIKETSISKPDAYFIAEEAYNELLNLSIPKNSNIVREIVLIKLLENNLSKEHKEYSRLGMPIHDVHNTIYKKDNENANTLYNAQLINSKLAGYVSKQYTLFHYLSPQLSRAHLTGEIHIHDLDYFMTAPFCFSHDIRFFLKEGFQPDGLNGKHVAVSGPAKNLDVAFNHAAKIMLTSSTYFSGGQGFDSLNLYLAPYASGLSYEQIKQAVESFVYEMDQILIRPGQTAFSSASLELNMPSYLKDIPVVLPRGKVTEKESYEDYIEEARKIAQAFTDVMTKGDYHGKPFHFPKPEYKIRKATLKDKEVEPLLIDIHKLVAKNGTPYFLNMAAPHMPDVLQSQCCRYFLTPDGDFWDEIKQGTVRSGSIQTVTINLPNIAYNANNDETKIYDIIDQRIEMLKELFAKKRLAIKKLMDNGNATWLTMDCYGKPYYKLDSATNSVGFIGLNEMVKALTGTELHESKDTWRLGLKIINYMAKKIESMSSSTGERWGMVQTPAESSAHRLAKLDLKKFSTKAIVQGNINSKAVYYTNSNHVNYSARISMFDRLKIDSSFHPIVKGGVISHIFLEENTPDPESLMQLSKKICSQTLTSYYSYTKDISTCNSCNTTFSGIIHICSKCGAPESQIQWFSRVTGYYTPVKSWNKGKFNEFISRKRYRI